MGYPPTHEECKRLYAELKRLAGSTRASDRKRRYEIIHDLAEAGFLEAKDYFIRGLDSEDPDLRWACISALVTHWRDDSPRIVTKLTRLAEADPDEQVRRIAMDSLGILKVAAALPLLKRVVQRREKETEFVVVGAYAAILRILGREASEIYELEDHFDESRIDEELLNTIES